MRKVHEITLDELEFRQPTKRRKKHASPPSLYHPPLRTGFTDYQNPKNYSPHNQEPKTTPSRTALNYQNVPNSSPSYKKPRKLHLAKNRREIVLENGVFTPSKIPNFFIKGKDPPKFDDFDESWDEYLEMKQLDSVRNLIYFTVYYRKWKQNYSTHFVQKIRHKSSLLNQQQISSNQNNSDQNIATLDTVELLERARQTIDQLTSSSSRAKSLSVNKLTSYDDYRQQIEQQKQFLLEQQQSSLYSSTTGYSQYSDLSLGSPMKTRSSILPDPAPVSPIAFPNDNKIPVFEKRRNQFQSLADSFHADDSSGIDRYASAYSALNVLNQQNSSDTEYEENSN